MYVIYFSFEQLWTVALWLTQQMVELITVAGQHSDRQPTTVVMQAITWWETVYAYVRLQECGLQVNLPVIVRRFSSLFFCY